jgi:hypothetical protein
MEIKTDSKGLENFKNLKSLIFNQKSYRIFAAWKQIDKKKLVAFYKKI